MDYDIPAVDEFPAVITRALMSIRDLQTELIDQTPDLMYDTSEMGNGCDRTNDEAVGP